MVVATMTTMITSILSYLPLIISVAGAAGTLAIGFHDYTRAPKPLAVPARARARSRLPLAA